MEEQALIPVQAVDEVNRLIVNISKAAAMDRILEASPQVQEEAREQLWGACVLRCKITGEEPEHVLSAAEVIGHMMAVYELAVMATLHMKARSKAIHQGRTTIAPPVRNEKGVKKRKKRR